jgi:transcriptional regulator with XRE-family HTH domain
MNTNQASSNQNCINKFSQLLKHWRQLRRISQLELAGLANISARHVSFLESSRSKPSREMVKLIGIALDLPFEEQNVLHLAAGFVPPYNNNTNITENDTYVRQELDFILSQNEPYPAIVIDGHWDICMRNEASKRLFAPFHQAYDIDKMITNNAMHTVFHPKGLRQFIVNWEEFAGELAQILHREIAQGHQLSSPCVSW